MKLPVVLSTMFSKETIPHAILFTGLGREEVAEIFAKHLLKHEKKFQPDLHHFYPEGKSGVHPIEKIRLLIEEVAFCSYDGGWKIFIIHDAEKMPLPSSNALLKTLEEPTPNTVLLLLSERGDLLPTIRSRCQFFFFPEKKLASKTASQNLLFELLFSPEKENYLYLRKMLDKICKEQENEKERSLLLQTVMEWARDLTAFTHGATSLLHEDLREHYETYLSATASPNLFQIVDKVKEAKLALERSTKLSTCLEVLFLGL